MSILQLIVLAIVQGVTEFIPVSSSAHLILVPIAVPGWPDQGPLIDVAVHVGSLGAVMLYFRTETIQLTLGALDTLALRESENRKLFLLIAFATIPTVLVVPIVYFTGMIEVLRSPVVIGMASIGFGLLLWIADRRASNKETDKEFTWKTVAAIGLAQALAIIPGTSRAGITITAARFFGYTRTESARFSMLLSIPTIMALGLMASLQLASGEEAVANLQDAFFAAVLSFAAAYGTIHIFLKMTEKMSFTPFVIYRCVLGMVLIALAIM